MFKKIKKLPYQVNLYLVCKGKKTDMIMKVFLAKLGTQHRINRIIPDNE